MSTRTELRPGLRAVVATWMVACTGCTSLTPQLPPTDFARLEQVESRDQREHLYAEQQIYTHKMPQGLRYTKGTQSRQPPRSWQALDTVLRADEHAAAALPERELRRSRLFAALTVAAGIVTVAGVAASAREGLNLGALDGAGGMLLGGGVATVGFAITSGLFYSRSSRGYERAVEIYNDSLGMRLGILDGAGNFVPPPGALLDEQGNMILDGETPGLRPPRAEPATTADDAGGPATPPTESFRPSASSIGPPLATCQAVGLALCAPGGGAKPGCPPGTAAFQLLPRSEKRFAGRRVALHPGLPAGHAGCARASGPAHEGFLGRCALHARRGVRRPHGSSNPDFRSADLRSVLRPLPRP